MARRIFSLGNLVEMYKNSHNLKKKILKLSNFLGTEYFLAEKENTNFLLPIKFYESTRMVYFFGANLMN